MATNTYVALQTQTLASAASSVTFNSIPQGYTDLVLVSSVLGQTSTSYIPKITLNNDSGSNYSNTWLYGTGSSAGSGRTSNAAYMYLGQLNGYMTTGSPDTFITQLLNYSNTTTYKTMLSRGNDASAGVDSTVGLYRSTSAISRVDISLLSGTNFQAGSTFSLYGVAAQPQPTAKATGGTIYYGVDGYTYHAFTSSGTFTPSQNLTADVLVVAGGGGGGSYYGGGGGAGGVSYLAAGSLTSGTGYTCTVGGGGAGANPGYGSNGANSVFGSITSNGGGGGGYFLSGYGYVGLSGGSGGGGGMGGSAGVSEIGGSPTQGSTGGATGYGFVGGTGYRGSSGIYHGGGGGGAGQAGANAVNANDPGSKGGDGLNTWATWLSVTGLGVSGYIAGGGGASTEYSTPGQGGAGGGGTGGAGGGAASAAVANTGSGGGADGASGSGSKAGGSGLVIVRYVS
jgi:hypothetical protein